MSIRPVKKLTAAKPTLEGAGVHLRRAFGFGETSDYDPFLLLDDFRNDRPEDYLAGFPWHPHRGIETITYVLAGNVAHADSLGNRGSLGAGDIQWMTAGRGILHQEMPQGDPGGRMHGFQLWANLPSSLKMTAPRYQDIGPERIPVVQPAAGVEVKVIAGELAGAAGPVEGIVTAPVYLDIGLQPGAQFTLDLPAGHHGFAYVFDGESALVGGEQLRRSELGVLSDGEQLQLAGGDKPARLLVVAGKPLNESVARYGPFVMNTPEQIHEAIADFRAGKF